jgi:hypothetical protein
MQLREKQFSGSVNKSLLSEITAEYRKKESAYKTLLQKKPSDYIWIHDDELILDLIFLSIFYRRVIYPMEETVKFYEMINDPSLYPFSTEKHQSNPIIPKKIIIGTGSIDKELKEKEIGINVIELQKIIDDFHIVLRSVDIPPKLLFYPSIDQFLQNIKSLVGVTNEYDGI